MLCSHTPIEDYRKLYGLWVKREDLSCPPPGPPFSKTRGVYAHLREREERVIGVLDTYHSQAGHAVARACQVLEKQCINFYPEFKREPGPRAPQWEAVKLGAVLEPLPAGRSAILFHAARRLTERMGGYMMPNALKLNESVTETAAEVRDTDFDLVILPVSSGTIAAGVIRGFRERGEGGPTFILHLGYSRAHGAVLEYVKTKSEYYGARLVIVDQKYAYRDRAAGVVAPPFPCNPYYDLKALEWWVHHGRERYARSHSRILFWNIG
jgi:hypothetical protein